MQDRKKLKLSSLNPLLTCDLCKGYFIDATTIIECLHSFCRTCIVHYLQNNQFCPSCDVQIHKTRPLVSIRSDQTLQDIVYKVVPGLFKNEMKRRRDFYRQNDPLIQKSIPSSAEKRGEICNCSSIEAWNNVCNSSRLFFTSEDIFSVSIEYLFSNCQPSKNSIEPHIRFLQCPGAFNVRSLKKFLEKKYYVDPDQKVEVFYMHDSLKDDYTFVDLAYIYSWKRREPLQLSFQILPKCKGKSDPKTTIKNGTFTQATCLPQSPKPCPFIAIQPIRTISPSVATAILPHNPSAPTSPQMAEEPLEMNKPVHAASLPSSISSINPQVSSSNNFETLHQSSEYSTLSESNGSRLAACCSLSNESKCSRTSDENNLKRSKDVSLCCDNSFLKHGTPLKDNSSQLSKNSNSADELLLLKHGKLLEDISPCGNNNLLSQNTASSESCSLQSESNCLIDTNSPQLLKSNSFSVDNNSKPLKHGSDNSYRNSALFNLLTNNGNHQNQLESSYMFKKEHLKNNVTLQNNSSPGSSLAYSMSNDNRQILNSLNILGEKVKTTQSSNSLCSPKPQNDAKPTSVGTTMLSSGFGSSEPHVGNSGPTPMECILNYAPGQIFEPDLIRTHLFLSGGNTCLLPSDNNLPFSQNSGLFPALQCGNTTQVNNCISSFPVSVHLQESLNDANYRISPSPLSGLPVFGVVKIATPHELISQESVTTVNQTSKISNAGSLMVCNSVETSSSNSTELRSVKKFQSNLPPNILKRFSSIPEFFVSESISFLDGVSVPSVSSSNCANSNMVRENGSPVLEPVASTSKHALEVCDLQVHPSNIIPELELMPKCETSKNRSGHEGSNSLAQECCVNLTHITAEADAFSKEVAKRYLNEQCADCVVKLVKCNIDTNATDLTKAVKRHSNVQCANCVVKLGICNINKDATESDCSPPKLQKMSQSPINSPEESIPSIPDSLLRQKINGYCSNLRPKGPLKGVLKKQKSKKQKQRPDRSSSSSFKSSKKRVTFSKNLLEVVTMSNDPYEFKDIDSAEISSNSQPDRNNSMMLRKKDS